MVDLARVKRNVSKMVGLQAPEADIDAYIASEGTTIEAVRAFKATTTTDLPMGYGAGSELSGNVEMAPPMQPTEHGVPMNVAGGINRTLLDLTGGFVDRAKNVINWGIVGKNAIEDFFSPPERGLNDLVAGSDGKPDLLRGTIDHAFGDSDWIAENVLDPVGIKDPRTIQPVTTAEKLAAGFGTGVVGALAPELLLSTASRVGAVAPATVEALTPLVGNAGSMGSIARNAVAGGTAGIGAEAAMEAAPEPLKPLAGVAGGLAGGGAGVLATEAPALVSAGGRVAADFLAPLTAGGRERLAGKALREGADNPGQVIDAIDNSDEVLSGSRPTTFQQTGDMGLGSMERSVALKSPDAFVQRGAEQNRARLDAIEGLQPTGAPEEVAKGVRGMLDELDAFTQQSVDDATRLAQERASSLGPGRTPEMAGDNIRASLEAARAAAKQHERQLWSAVDPDGRLSLQVPKLQASSRTILEQLPMSAKQPEGEEAAIFDVLSRYRTVMPFSEVTALQSRVKTAMMAERVAYGESPAYRRLVQLNAALQDDLEGAIVQKVAQEQQAVAAGQMRFEDTTEALLQRWVDDWQQRKEQAGLVASAGAGAHAGGRSTAIPGARGAEGQAGRITRGDAGDPGLSANDGDLAANFDAGALDRLKAARGATRARAETFDNSTLAPIRRRPGTTSPYDMPAAAVAQRLLFPGPKSFEAINAARAALGDEQATRLIAEYAIDRLRRAALRDDGTLDPIKLAAWRRNHSDALRALPQLDAALSDAATASDAMGSVLAIRREGLDDAQKGLVGRLFGVTDPQDVTRVVGSIFSRQDAVAQLRALRRAVAGNADAEQGLRKAVADFLVDRFVTNREAGTSGLGTINGDQLVTFVSRNKAALQAAGFTDDELRTIEAVAADLQQAARSASSLRVRGQGVAPDVMAAADADGKTSMLAKIILASLASGGGTGFLAGPFVGAVTTVATGLIAVLRQNGIRRIDDLIRDALLDPALARDLMVKAAPKEAHRAAMSIAQRITKATAVGAAVDDDAPPAKATSAWRPIMPTGQAMARPVSMARPQSLVAAALMSRTPEGEQKSATLDAIKARMLAA